MPPAQDSAVSVAQRAVMDSVARLATDPLLTTVQLPASRQEGGQTAGQSALLASCTASTQAAIDFSSQNASNSARGIINFEVWDPEGSPRGP